MSELLLSRARLRPRRIGGGAGPAAGAGRSQRPAPAASHQLVWSLFADGPERRRDFLWREEAPGRFMTLSSRPPVDVARACSIWILKPFAPVLAAGDRLGFTLRANPVVARADGTGPTRQAPRRGDGRAEQWSPAERARRGRMRC